QDCEPGSDIGCVVFTDLRSKLQVCAEECGPELGHKVLAGVAFIAEALPAKIALDARRMLRPVRRLVRKCRIEACSVAEARKRSSKPAGCYAVNSPGSSPGHRIRWPDPRWERRTRRG